MENNSGPASVRLRKLTLAQAKAQFPHRFTCEHLPDWAKREREDGTYYAPGYSSDQEWYENTVFPGEPGVSLWAKHCFSTGHTWPLGTWLHTRFAPGLQPQAKKDSQP